MKSHLENGINYMLQLQNEGKLANQMSQPRYIDVDSMYGDMGGFTAYQATLKSHVNNSLIFDTINNMEESDGFSNRWLIKPYRQEIIFHPSQYHFEIKYKPIYLFISKNKGFGAIRVVTEKNEKLGAFDVISHIIR